MRFERSCQRIFPPALDDAQQYQHYSEMSRYFRISFTSPPESRNICLHPCHPHPMQLSTCCKARRSLHRLGVHAWIYRCRYCSVDEIHFPRVRRETLTSAKVAVTLIDCSHFPTDVADFFCVGDKCRRMSAGGSAVVTTSTTSIRRQNWTALPPFYVTANLFWAAAPRPP